MKLASTDLLVTSLVASVRVPVPAAVPVRPTGGASGEKPANHCRLKVGVAESKFFCPYSQRGKPTPSYT